MKKLITFIIALCTVTFACARQSRGLRCRILPGTASSTEAVVFWEFPDNYKKVSRYDICIDGKTVGHSVQNSFRLTGLRPETLYDITVKALRSTGSGMGTGKTSLNTPPEPQIFDVRKYGAKGDGISNDTKAIQKAIDECTPYGEVLIPEGTYVTGALFVQKDNIGIRISPEATLMAVNNLAHFPLVENRYEGNGVMTYSSVLNIGKLDNKGRRFRNIRIFGGGTIDNRGSLLARQQTENLSRMARSRGLPIINCDSVAVDGITITNPCTWNVHPLLCNGVTTYECRLVSSGFGLSNADGWDPDSSSDCYLLNSTLDGQDDNIALKSQQFYHDGREIRKPCENIYVSFCRFVRGGGICVGVELPAGVRNAWFTNCIVERSDRGFQICSRQKGQGTGAIEDIHFRDIEVWQTGDWGININLWYWIESYMPGEAAPEDIRKIRNIFFENIHIRKADGNAIQIIGMKEQPIRDVFMKNIRIDDARYDVLLRHCSNIKFENVDVGNRHWWLDDAENVTRDRRTSRPADFNYPHKTTDKDAGFRTKALYANLISTAKSGRFFFGAQDATSSGYGWYDDSGRSDIERISGKKPQFYSWDFMNIATPHSGRHTQDTRKVRRLTCRAFYEGGINSYCWHAANPVTGGSFYETGDSVVSKILPGGKYHDNFKKMLDQIAGYNKTLIGKDGEQIPIIFRPWHEFDGDWFWWGKKYCTAEEFKQLYRFTVTYLRDSCGVHNFLYAFSPDINFTSEKEYLERYPGDEFVDIIAMDNYWNFRAEEKNADEAHKRLKIISDYAAKTGKVAALSETGQGGIDDNKWFSEKLLKSIYGYPDRIELAYVAVWRNSVQGFFTPYKGHPATDDFLKFMDDPRVISSDPYDWLGKYYHFDNPGETERLW